MKITRSFLMTALTIILAACGSSPMVRNDNAVKYIPSANTTSVKKPGGYYLDDGPSDNAPANIDSIPDAIPHAETPLARANKPYTALGARYTPMTSYEPFKQAGKASWYGKRYHGKKTSSGEAYDMFAMSAAHTTLPLPSYVRVSNPANGKSVIVRVNDRGPFHADRIIDLSYAAAYKLRLANSGSGYVEIETVDANTFKPSNTTVVIDKPIESKAVAAPITTTQSTGSASIELQPSSNISLTSTNNPNGDLAQYYVQAGAFKSDANAQKLSTRIGGLDLASNIGIASSLYKDGFYRVKLGPYTSRQEADISASNLRKKLAITALVVNQ